MQHQVEQLKAQLDAVGDNKDTVTILSSDYEQMQRNLDQLEQQINWLTEQLVTMSRQKFGAKSESMNNEIVEQLSLTGNEPEMYLNSLQVKEIQVPAHKRQRKMSVLNEEKLPDDFETEIIEHRLSGEELECPVCGQTMTEIGKEVKRSLKIIPAMAVVVEDWYYTYVCFDV